MDIERLIHIESRSTGAKGPRLFNKQTVFYFLVIATLISFWSYYLLVIDSVAPTPIPIKSKIRGEAVSISDRDFTNLNGNNGDRMAEYIDKTDIPALSVDPEMFSVSMVPVTKTSTFTSESSVDASHLSTAQPHPPSVLTSNQATTPICRNVDSSESSHTMGKAIFLIDSIRPADTVLNLSPRQACAVESAAKHNPDWTVILLTLNTHILDAPTSNTSALREYLNIKIVNTTLEDLVRGTIAENWVARGALVQSQYPVVHYSDFLRLFVLYKYGGVYLDTDFIILKSLDPILPNFSVAESENWVASAAMGFTRGGFGHFLAQHLVSEFMNSFNGSVYAYNGPALLTRFFQYICYTTTTVNMTRDNCFDFEVLPTKTFYPIGYDAYEPLFNETWLDQTMNLVKDSFAMHAWNGLIGAHHLQVGTKSALGVMAEQNCPKVYASCGSLF